MGALAERSTLGRADEEAGSSGAAVRFSIFIPIRNDAEWLPRAIESVIAQTHEAWELVIGDSDSPEDLAAVVARYPDPRIRYHRWSTHVGVYENHNRTMLLCRHEWVQMLGADDWLHPRCLATMAARITEASGRTERVAVALTACRRVDMHGQPADRAFYGAQQVAKVPDGLYDACAWLRVTAVPGVTPWNFGSVALSRQVLSETGGFMRPEIGMCADVAATLRLAAYGDVVYIDEPLLEYTVRQNSIRNARFTRNRAQGNRDTVMGAALLSALAVHEHRRPVSRAERAAVRATIAYWHLQRAAHHRYLPGGHGRRGAVLDLMRAAMYSPQTVLTPKHLAYGAAAVLAPRSTIEWVKAGVLARRR